MAGPEQELDRSEEATPFKLRRAREQGQVARGMDLGFVGSLLAVGAFVLWFGTGFVFQLAQTMRASLTTGVARAGQSGDVLALVRESYWSAFQPLVVLGGIVLLVLITLELIQLRGLVFSATPLKPDFTRLNPAAGIKRLFSLRMVKEALKNVFKMAVYALLAWLMVTAAIDTFGDSVGSAASLVRALDSASMRLLFAFGCAAVFFMLVDQVIARKEFGKQMRMSRRELKREVKDHEGEPRLKQKRRQLHAELRKQSDGLANIGEADFLVVNPDHYAVALKYVPGDMAAPEVLARGRNHFAQALKRKARLLNVPIIADPVLARALYRDCRQGQPVHPRHFHAVARHYSRRQRQARALAAATPETQPEKED